VLTRTPPEGSGVVGASFNLDQPFQPTTEYGLKTSRQTLLELAAALNINITRISIVTTAPVNYGNNTSIGYTDGTAVFFEIAPSLDPNAATPEEAIKELQLQANDPTSAIRASPLLGLIDPASVVQLCEDGLRRRSCPHKKGEQTEANGWPFAIAAVIGFLLFGSGVAAIYYTKHQRKSIGKPMNVFGAEEVGDFTDLEKNDDATTTAAATEAQQLDNPYQFDDEVPGGDDDTPIVPRPQITELLT
jgi:hypothetical protein